MKAVFTAQHPTEAHLVEGILESEGIAASVQGESLFGARGELPVTSDSLPSVWVLDDDEAPRARDLLKDFHREAQGSSMGSWTCSSCGETLGAQFTNCWQCGADRPPAD